MESLERAMLARLRSAWLKRMAIAAAERARLIEMAGEQICTGFGGPTQQEVDRLEKLERAHRLAWDKYASKLSSTNSSSVPRAGAHAFGRSSST